MKSQYEGTVMMRPVLGDTAGAVVNIPDQKKESFDIKLFPNPVTDRLHIVAHGDYDAPLNGFHVEVFSTGGQRVTTVRTQREVVLNDLPAGLYLVRITDPEKGVVLKQARIVVQTPRW